MSLIRNRPTDEGRALGKRLATFADQADAAMRESRPGWPERCKTCAFRLGTVPNGCPATVMDALKCSMERTEFRCHERLNDAKETDHPCMGWASLVMTSKGDGVDCPWPFSDEEEPASQGKGNLATGSATELGRAEGEKSDTQGGRDSG